MEYPNPNCDPGTPRGRADTMTVLHLEDVTTYGENPADIMDNCIEQYGVPEDKQVRNKQLY
jgi:hypothetical protein